MSSPHPLARTGRIGWIATLLLVLTCRSAFAVPAAADTVSPPPPPPGDSLLYIRDVIVGRSECPTCPPRVCPDHPVLVTVRGQFPNACYRLRSLTVAPNRGLFPLVVADVVFVGCTNDCSILPVGFEASVELPAAPPGDHTFALREQARLCPDTTVVSSDLGRLVTYTVQPDCGSPPPPVDSLVRTFVKLAIVPEHPCPGDSVTLQLLKNGCPPCVHLVSFGKDPVTNASFAGVIDWRPECGERLCVYESLSAPMGRLQAGSYHVLAPMTVRVLGTANPDSTIAFTIPFDFQVGPSCGGPPPLCVVREMFSTVPAHQCALTIAPPDTGLVPVLYSSDLPMAGVQGSMHVPAPFRLTDLRLASDVIGAHLSWYMVRGVLDEVRWIVFTDPGVSLAPGTRQHLLDAAITVDPMVPLGVSQLMTATITLASDADGHELPLCNRETFEIIAIRLCVAAAGNSACDVNHDGRLDVRDLVRMVGCLGDTTRDSTGARTCVDCDSSGAFDINDIFCCATDILRGPGVPRDSVHSDAAVNVSFDPIEAMGSGDLLVRVRVGGARALGAAMLRFDYPAIGWRASLPVRIMSPRPVDVDWYPIVDVSQPGRIDVGGLRLGDTGADEFVFEVVMTPTAVPLRDPTPQGRLDAVAADLAARNGAVITPMGALPSVVLEPGASSGGNALALSPARPNPFNGSTTFAIRLPATAPVDLAVHDLAGRRIATLAHAVYGPGEHSFTWDGAGARDGLYFVQLTVNGQVLSTRVAMLKGSR